MEIEQKQKVMYNRFLSLTNEQMLAMGNYAEYIDNRYSWLHTPCETDQEISEQCHNESYIDHWWGNCILGKQYTKLKLQAGYWLKNPQKFSELMEIVQSKKRWGTMRGYNLKDTELELFTVMCFLKGLSSRKEDYAIWQCYKNEPKFKTGDIVKFRSNTGVDAVLKKHNYGGNHSNYYGCGNHELVKAKKKTYMIIEVDPKLDGSCYAKTYAYHEKQGGCRYYKVLPMGEAKTYFVVEKFLKKFRMPK